MKYAKKQRLAKDLVNHFYVDGDFLNYEHWTSGEQSFRLKDFADRHGLNRIPLDDEDAKAMLFTKYMSLDDGILSDIHINIFHNPAYKRKSKKNPDQLELFRK